MKHLSTTKTATSKTYSEKLLGLLQEQNHVCEEDLQLVSRLQKQSRGRSIAAILVDAGVEEEAVQKAVAQVSGLYFAKITSEYIAHDLVEKLGVNEIAQPGDGVGRLAREGGRVLGCVGLGCIYVRVDVRRGVRDVVGFRGAGFD